eukprot:1208620-Pleurochrysis_carterae.AAC.1
MRPDGVGRRRRGKDEREGGHEQRRRAEAEHRKRGQGEGLPCASWRVRALRVSRHVALISALGALRSIRTRDSFPNSRAASRREWTSRSL